MKHPKPVIPGYPKAVIKQDKSSEIIMGITNLVIGLAAICFGIWGALQIGLWHATVILAFVIGVSVLIFGLLLLFGKIKASEERTDDDILEANQQEDLAD